MMLDIPGVLDPAAALELRARLEKGDWSDGARSASGAAALAKQNRQLNANDATARLAAEQITAALRRNQSFVAAALPNRIYPPMFNRYEAGQNYGPHVDNAMMAIAPDEPLLRTDISATLFLSDASEYEGGQLVVQTSFGEQEIKLDAGDLILYPSSSVHTVLPVTAGKRVCAVFWVESLVPEAERRSILFELDQSIQSLTASPGTTPSLDTELTRLAGVYHNLIRTWSRR